MLKTLESFCRVVIGRAYVRVVGANRELSWIFFSVALPVVYLASYCFFFKGLKSNPIYLGYVILGGSLMAFWLNVLWGMATQFYWEKEVGNLELYLIAPISRMGIMLGMAVGGMYSITLRALASFFISSWLFKVPFAVSNWPQFLAAFFLTMAALYGLGMMAASLFLLWGRSGYYLSELFQEPVFFLSGFYFPVKALGMGLAGLAGILPITLGLDAMRQLLYAPGKLFFLPVNWEILLLLVQSVIYGFLADYCLKTLEYKAKAEGRLTSRWL